MHIVDTLSSCLGAPFPAPGNETRWNCPQCSRRGKTVDLKGHLYINLKKRLYWCHRCEWKGKLDWLLKHFGVSESPTLSSWADTIRRLRVITGEDYREGYDHTEEIEYPCGTLSPEEGLGAYSYLMHRGLAPNLIDMYKIRVGASGTRWEYRIFVPTLHDDLLTFWVARDFSGDHPVKYMNPYGRSRRYHVFNLDRAKNYKSVIITEGVFSAISAGPNAVATFGKYVALDQLLQLSAANFETYYVALDGDARPQTVYVATWLKRRGHQDVRIVSLPLTDDPDSVKDFPRRVHGSRPFDFKTRVEFVLGRDR